MKSTVKMLPIALLACLFVGGTAKAGIVKEDSEEQDPCRNVFCHAGQECIVEERNATCQCIPRCPEHENVVCGSDGITYPNHCELHRTACEQSKKISIENRGPCKVSFPTQPPTGKVHKSKPVVCYEQNRDDLRGRLIVWLRLMGEVVDGVTGDNNIFKKYFELMDYDKNGKLDRKEFNNLIQANATVAQIQGADQYVNPILQGLCTDALIAMTDQDSDWELSFREFMRCMDPEFKPPHKYCELEGKRYKDGAEIPTDCNSCVCACGNWVCTALNCNAKELTKEGETKFVLKGKEAKRKLKADRHGITENQEEVGKDKVLMLLKSKKGHE